jgi:tRNA 2-thiouridine synthesizing protein E
MAEKTYAGVTVTVDPDGFLEDPTLWTKEIAEGIAEELGMTLTDRHWVVLDFIRNDAVDQGEPPGVRRITKLTDVSMKEIYKLFPKGPGILASKLAGYGKPQGCV